jgi:pyridoxal phosphate enzyme (YggS family)
MTEDLNQNLITIRTKIEDALSQVAFTEKPLLLAVSKKQPIEKIEALYNLGVRDFGENYLQEVLEKQEQLKSLDIRWHFIGQIQRKKIKDMVGNFDLLQTVSRLEEMQKIQSVAEEKNVQQKILIQVNIALETTKQGVEPEKLQELIEKAVQFKNLELKGLMFFPPLSEKEEDSLMWFEKCQALFKKMQESFPQNMQTLSMGTSSDYPLAIQKGSNLIRLGECLMGPRN